jgi:carbon-monoxide dehydrogenase small subunit
MTSTSKQVVSLNVNGVTHDVLIEARKTLADVLRDDLGLTGTKLGCEHGVCGACTVLVDGRAVRACLMFAIQAQGSEVSTVEGLDSDGKLDHIQQAFADNHGLQCGYCTPGMLMSATALLRRTPKPSPDEIKKGIQGNICRCTGYWNIVDAVTAASGQEVPSRE